MSDRTSARSRAILKRRPAEPAGLFSCVVIERIAGRTDGPDQIGPAICVQRLPQPAHMDVDGTRIDIGIMRPDRVEQPFAREDAARMFEEMAEQAEFRG